MKEPQAEAVGCGGWGRVVRMPHQDESVLAGCSHSDLGPITWLFSPPPTSRGGGVGRREGSVNSSLSSAAWHPGF